MIDDHADVLDGVLRILEYGGYEAEGTTRFTHDINTKLKTEPFCLIILDVMLSGSDGRDIARQFKSDKETKDIPILMMSAYPNVEGSVKRAGAEYFIKKPFGVNEMISKLESIGKGEK
ncbi:MAG TPA: response regulator [Balneolaceae bacterium]